MTTGRPPAIDAPVRPTAGQRDTDVGFIIGPARSGTSLVYKCVSLHPDAAYLTNWQARYPATPAWSATTRLASSLRRRRREVWFAGGDAYVYGRRRSWTERAFPMPVEGESVYRAAGIGAPGGLAPRDVDPGVALPQSFRRMRQMAGGSVLVSKRISNNLRIPQLNEAIPEARYVIVIRDGRAVARSLSQVDWWRDSYVWWCDGTPATWESSGGDPWEICARNWVEELRAIKVGVQVLDPAQVLTIRYEDMIGNPIETLESVVDHLGLPRNATWRRELEALSFPDKNEAWRQRLTPEAIATITDIQREELVAHGYDA